MKITPLDIDQVQFQRVFRGCDPDEVHAFLDQVSREMEELIRDSAQLRESLRRREEELESYQQQERQLREAMVAAGRMTEEIKESAERESRLILAEAGLQAEGIVKGARDEVVSLREEVSILRRQKARLLAELRAVVDGHARMLEAQEQLDREAERARAERNGSGRPDR